MKQATVGFCSSFNRYSNHAYGKDKQLQS